jgi:hypothetical protein
MRSITDRRDDYQPRGLVVRLVGARRCTSVHVGRFAAEAAGREAAGRPRVSKGSALRLASSGQRPFLLDPDARRVRRVEREIVGHCRLIDELAAPQVDGGLQSAVGIGHLALLDPRTVLRGDGDEVCASRHEACRSAEVHFTRARQRERAAVGACRTEGEELVVLSLN